MRKLKRKMATTQNTNFQFGNEHVKQITLITLVTESNKKFKM